MKGRHIGNGKQNIVQDVRRKTRRSLSAKATALTLALALLLTPTGAFALDTVDEKGDAFKEFTQGGVTYYDIYNGKTKDRPDVTDVDQLIQQVIYEKKDGQNYSAAEYWAAMAASIFASNEPSWRSYGAEGGHGTDKDAGEYKDRLTKDPENGKGYYGNLQKWLFSKSGAEDDTGNGSKYRKNDINMRASGMMTAQSLAEVEDMAFQYLVDINPGKIDRNDFSEYNSLQGMNEESSAGDVIYHLMATRDRDGSTFRYIYNCFGIAYYDFQAAPFTGDEGEGLTTALKGYNSYDEAADAAGETIEGFEYNASSKQHIDRVKNTSTEEASKEVSADWSQDEELSSEVTTLKGMTFGQEESAEFTFGKDDAFFHATAGFTFSEEELFQEGLNTTNSTAKHDGGSSSTGITLLPHTALEQVMLTTDTESTSRYDCPMMITYKVAIFSYNGEYYDDNALTTYFNTADYEQRSFMTVFGNDTDGAVESLRTCMAKDAGYDSSYRLTRGIREEHASNDDAHWDTPWVNHLDYAAMKSAAATVGITPSYDEASGVLSANQPISITGGLLSRKAMATDTIIGDALQIYPLDSVTLAKAQRDLITIKEDEDLHLRNINVEAWDSEGVEFHKFIYTEGYWTLVNKDGEPIENSKAIKLYQNKNGDYVVRGKAPGRGYIKYMIPEDTYQYINAENTVVTVEPDKVDTPTITITVKENTEVATKIAVEGDVDVYYDASEFDGKDVVIDLEKVDGLEAVVYDQKGKMMEVKAQWEPVSGTDGIKIKDNKMTVYEDGDYKLTAVYDEVESESVGIHVEKRTLTEIQVPTSVNLSYIPDQPVALANIEGLTATPVDQEGNVMEGVAVTWSVKGEASGIEIEDGNLTVINDKAETYPLVAAGGGMESSEVSLICSLDPDYAAAQEKVNTFLSCSSEQTALAEACLFVKNKMGQESTINEVIFTEALLQLAGEQGRIDEQKKYELEALIWAVRNGLVSSSQGRTLTIGGGITSLQMAILAYNANVKFGKDVSCEDVIGDYAGSEDLTEEQKTAMNWAISKGCLTHEEEESKTLDVDRIVTDAELDAYNVKTVANPEVSEEEVEKIVQEKKDETAPTVVEEPESSEEISDDGNADSDENSAETAEGEEAAAEKGEEISAVEAGDEAESLDAAESTGEADEDMVESDVVDENEDGIFESAGGEIFIQDGSEYIQVKKMEEVVGNGEAAAEQDTDGEDAESAKYVGDVNNDGIFGNMGDVVYTSDGEGGFAREILDKDIPAEGVSAEDSASSGNSGAAIWIVLIAVTAVIAGAVAVVMRKNNRFQRRK